MSTSNDGCHHGVVYHFASVWDAFVLANCVSHEGDIIYWNPEARRGEAAVSVAPSGLRDVPHEGGVADEETIAFYCLTPDERHHVAGQDEVPGLEGGGRAAGVGEPYARAPGEEVILPGSISNRLFSAMGLMQTPCNRASIMHEMSSALGWN